jgi:hypothetical protein
MAVSLASFAAGVLAHKTWRVMWRVNRQPVGWRRALEEEFAPPTPEVIDDRKARAPRITEVG